LGVTAEVTLVMLPARRVPHCAFGQTPARGHCARRPCCARRRCSARRRVATSKEQRFMMTRMPDLSRRAVLRLGAGSAAGAVGVYALDRLLGSRPPLTAPVALTGNGGPMA